MGRARDAATPPKMHKTAPHNFHLLFVNAETFKGLSKTLTSHTNPTQKDSVNDSANLQFGIYLAAGSYLFIRQ